MRPGCSAARLMRGALAALLIAGLLVQNPAVAEDLPTTGTFEGVYHRDRWGVGYFLFFIVHPDLHEKLAKYEGKLIRVEVTKGEQPHNPGPAIMLAVGEITELPQPPLEIRVKTRPGKLTTAEPFQVVIEVTNRSKDDSVLHPTNVGASIRQPALQPGQKPDDPSWLIKEYTVGQLSVGEAQAPMETFQERTNLNGRGGEVLLSPGASYVCVTSFPEGIPSGESELTVGLTYAFAEPKAAHGVWKSQGNMQLWNDFSVERATPSEQPAAEIESLLSASEVSVVPAEKAWSRLTFRLLPAEGRKVRVPSVLNRLTGEVDAEKFAFVAQLQGVAADGSKIKLSGTRFPERDTRDGVAQLLELPKAGAVIRAEFRKTSRFAPPVKRLLLSVLTDNGIETVVISDDFKDLDAPPDTPFGSQAEGVKIRIRPDKEVFKGTEPLEFHLQAVNVSGKPVCWWRPFSGLGENVVVEIDGKQIEQPDEKYNCIGGWAAEWTCKNPHEWTISLPDSVKVTKGKHVISYIIVSNGGELKNANDEMIPMVRGRVVSNEIGFSIE